MSSSSFDLRQALNHYPEVCLKCYGITFEFENLEQIFLQIKSGEEEFSKKHLDVLESAYCIYNGTKVPQLSLEEIRSINILLSNLEIKDEPTIEKLFHIIGNIEVVSCILRSVDPNNYGILGPQVENFLCTRGNSQIEKYMNLLEDLEMLAEKYSIDRIADAQIALWTLTQIINSTFLKYDALFRNLFIAYEEGPNYVKKIIAKNALQIFSTQDRLSKAELILDTDFVMAGILVSKELEVLIKSLCERSGIRTWEKNEAIGFRYLSIWELTDKLFQEKLISRKESETIKIWWFNRNHIIHEADVQISKDEVGEFIKGVLGFRERHFSKRYIHKIQSNYLANISH